MDEIVFGVSALVVVGLAAVAIRLMALLAAEAQQEFEESSDDLDPVW